MALARTCGSLIALFLLLLGWRSAAAAPVVYLIPGLGSDGRVFAHLDLGDLDTRVLELPVPEHNESLPTYAARVARGIDPAEAFALVGVSFGGMVAVEIARITDPTQVVLVSSAKGRRDLPYRYRFLRAVPLYRLFGGGFYAAGADLLRPVIEPDSRADRALFSAMIRGKDRRFIRRSVYCIATWEDALVPEGVVHIHGTRDHTLPFRSLEGDVIAVEGGSHVMVYTRGAEVSALIRAILGDTSASDG